MKHLAAVNDFNIEDIHGPYVPEDIRENELVAAELEVDKIKKTCRVWRISPLGIELLVNDMQLTKGQECGVVLNLGSQSTSLIGIVVDQISDDAGHNIAYLRLVTPVRARKDNEDRRFATRWMCSTEFFPTGIASNPVRFNDFIYFKVADISFGGFKLIASLRNKFLISGISFECLMNFPMISQINLKIKINNVRVENVNGKDVLAIGASYDTGSEAINKVISNYLLQFSNAETLEEIKQSGFLADTISETVNFTYVKTKEDFDEVLKLRFEAYKEAGKVADGKTYKDMTDHFDSKSRIVIGKLKGEIICSARLIFHQLGEKLEQEKFVEWTPGMPRQDEVVEIMRACTKPGFRGSDLLLGMFKFMAVTVAQTKKKWIVICATNEMVSFYERIGFKKVGKSYLHEGLNNIEHHVMIANFLDGMSGKTVGPIYWNIVWADSVSYMNHYDLIDVDPLMQIRITVYKWFKPLSNMLVQRKFKKRQKKISDKFIEKKITKIKE